MVSGRGSTPFRPGPEPRDVLFPRPPLFSSRTSRLGGQSSTSHPSLRPRLRNGDCQRKKGHDDVSSLGPLVPEKLRKNLGDPWDPMTPRHPDNGGPRRRGRPTRVRGESLCRVQMYLDVHWSPLPLPIPSEPFVRPSFPPRPEIFHPLPWKITSYLRTVVRLQTRKRGTRRGPGPPGRLGRWRQSAGFHVQRLRRTIGVSVLG